MRGFWDELRRRLPASVAEALVTGPSIEKEAIAPHAQFRGRAFENSAGCFWSVTPQHIVPAHRRQGV